jgi:hypothetical protein
VLAHCPRARDRRPKCSDLFSGRLERHYSGGDTVAETALRPSQRRYPWPIETASMSVMKRLTGLRLLIDRCLPRRSIGGGVCHQTTSSEEAAQGLVSNFRPGFCRPCR